MLVMKFGGTSIKDAAAMQNAIEIISTYKKKVLIVLSACAGITDKLEQLTTQAAKGNDYSIILNEINEHHSSIINSALSHEIKALAGNYLSSQISKISELAESIAVLGECTPKVKARFLSFGELLSTYIFNSIMHEQGIGSKLIFSGDYILTDNNYLNASPIAAKAKSLSAIQDATENYIIAQGFIGADANSGAITTLGRGGSDLSAAIFARMFGADKIIIWKDVDGLLTADPRIVENTKLIKTITYEEMRLLAAFGAKLLHPEAILPAIESSIPVEIRNTFKPTQYGTEIVSTQNSTDSCVNSIVIVKEAYLIETSDASIVEEINKFLPKKAVVKHFEESFAGVSRVIFEVKQSEIEAVLIERLPNCKAVSLIAVIGSNPQKMLIEKCKELLHDVILLSYNENSQVTIIADERENSNRLYINLHNSLFA